MDLGQEIVDRLVTAVQEQDVLFTLFWINEMTKADLVHQFLHARHSTRKCSAIEAVIDASFTKLRKIIFEILLLTQQTVLGTDAEHGDLVRFATERRNPAAVELLRSWKFLSRKDLEVPLKLLSLPLAEAGDVIDQTLPEPPNAANLTGYLPLPDPLPVPGPDAKAECLEEIPVQPASVEAEADEGRGGGGSLTRPPSPPRSRSPSSAIPLTANATVNRRSEEDENMPPRSSSRVSREPDRARPAPRRKTSLSPVALPRDRSLSPPPPRTQSPGPKFRDVEPNPRRRRRASSSAASSLTTLDREDPERRHQRRRTLSSKPSPEPMHRHASSSSSRDKILALDPLTTSPSSLCRINVARFPVGWQGHDLQLMFTSIGVASKVILCHSTYWPTYAFLDVERDEANRCIRLLEGSLQGGRSEEEGGGGRGEASRIRCNFAGRQGGAGGGRHHHHSHTTHRPPPTFRERSGTLDRDSASRPQIPLRPNESDRLSPPPPVASKSNSIPNLPASRDGERSQEHEDAFQLSIGGKARHESSKSTFDPDEREREHETSFAISISVSRPVKLDVDAPRGRVPRESQEESFAPSRSLGAPPIARSRIVATRGPVRV
ncbi:hypothetical protein JCM3766R1_006044 [Sporobolomyces carnicolor]